MFDYQHWWCIILAGRAASLIPAGICWGICPRFQGGIPFQNSRWRLLKNDTQLRLLSPPLSPTHACWENYQVSLESLCESAWFPWWPESFFFMPLRLLPSWITTMKQQKSISHCCMAGTVPSTGCRWSQSLTLTAATFGGRCPHRHQFCLLGNGILHSMRQSSQSSRFQKLYLP